MISQVSLLIVAAAPNVPVFSAGWALAGLAMAATFRRWPATTNPHLLINRWTAVDTAHTFIGTDMFSAVFRPTGLTLQTLRQDRILDEAFEVEDPLHLMRLFGIAANTAMRYINAAHPERTAKLPDDPDQGWSRGTAEAECAALCLLSGRAVPGLLRQG
ncbi:5-deoxy-glucuronate isomerase [Streptomyces viridochromogenes]|uniref:5-deoxy-glucuronate isomerase n=1 Tax=Streptomyces viridochromogenes TaxID=1938 RepID=UPI001F16440F|nr:5-deoxy-glucuronate isomerase [Streptomyces viridochromogenes]